MAETINDQNKMDERIKHIVEEIRQCKADAEHIERLKGELRRLLAEYGSNWSDDSGYARLVIGKRTNIR